LVKVRKLPGCAIIENPGALVNVITVATSEEEFQTKVRRRCEETSLFVSEIEDAEIVL